MGEDSSRNDNNNEKENLLNKLLNKSTISSYLIKSFSIPKSKVQVYLEFCEIAKREGGTFSNAVLRAFEEYNEKHRAGNPQLLITHYSKPEEPQPLRVLCPYCQGALSGGEVYCQRAGLWIKGIQCYSCKFNRLRKQK